MLNLYMILVFRIFVFMGEKDQGFTMQLYIVNCCAFTFCVDFILGINIIRPWSMVDVVNFVSVCPNHEAKDAFLDQKIYSTHSGCVSY